MGMKTPHRAPLRMQRVNFRIVGVSVWSRYVWNEDVEAMQSVGTVLQQSDP